MSATYEKDHRYHVIQAYNSLEDAIQFINGEYNGFHQYNTDNKDFELEYDEDGNVLGSHFITNGIVPKEIDNHTCIHFLAPDNSPITKYLLDRFVVSEENLDGTMSIYIIREDNGNALEAKHIVDWFEFTPPKIIVKHAVSLDELKKLQEKSDTDEGRSLYSRALSASLQFKTVSMYDVLRLQDWGGYVHTGGRRVFRGYTEVDKKDTN